MRNLINRAITWAKENKLAAVLLAIFLFVFVKPMFSNLFGISHQKSASFGAPYGAAGSSGASFEIANPLSQKSYSVSDSFRPVPPPSRDIAPQPNIQDRMVVVASQMSILTKNVRESIDQIQTEAQNIGGYMTSKNISTPRAEGTESGTITVRIPLNVRDSYIEFLRNVGLKVVNERIQADDVTDQYVDIEGRLSTLNRTKARYEKIMESAQDVDEILRVQQKIFSVQDQIDRLVGQRNKLNATSRSTLITVNLSTDELALPFTPEHPWRPGTVFKLAVRSLLTNLQGLGSLAIWLAVYSVIWVPAIVLFIFVRKFFFGKKSPSDSNNKL